MSRLSWRKASLAVLLSLSATLVPTVGRAASTPKINSLVAFGDKRPGDAGVTPEEYRRIYPNSQPYGGSQYEKGLAYVVGNAEGPISGDGLLRLFVTITITAPDAASVSRTVHVQELTEEGSGYVQGNFNAEIPVSELGTHLASDPPTPLTVTAFAHTPDGSMASSTVTSADVLQKYAASPYDTTKPVLQSVNFPPANWCHLSSEGAKDPISGNQNFGGTRQGDCGRVSPLPDATWLVCIKETSQLPDPTRQALADVWRMTPFFNNSFDPNDEGDAPGSADFWSNPARSRYCRTGEAASVPRGERSVDGRAVDDATTPYASEIERVEVKVYQGATVIREYTTQAAARLSRYQGTRASFSVPMRITDFEPNYPGGQPYKITVQAFDAYGLASDIASSPNITVYPW
ncbi:MAG TPA: hypothetical protein VM600_04775 [Actinomycetota bacterium]|nr:hypothetical protein [Actinomycetota bacterium]